MGKTASGAIWLSERADLRLRLLPVLRQRRRSRREPFPAALHLPAVGRDRAVVGVAGRRAAGREAGPGIRGHRHRPWRRGGETARRAAQAAFGEGAAGVDVPSHEVSAAELAAGLEGRRRARCFGAGRFEERGSATRGTGRRPPAATGRSTRSTMCLRADEIDAAGVLLHAGKKHLRRISSAGEPVLAGSPAGAPRARASACARSSGLLMFSSEASSGSAARSSASSSQWTETRSARADVLSVPAASSARRAGRHDLP